MKRALQLLTGLITGGFLATPTLAQANYSTPYTFTTIAGTAGNTGGNDGTNGGAQFFSPEGIAVDTNGNLYVVDNNENTIRKVALVGTNWVVTTIAGNRRKRWQCRWDEWCRAVQRTGWDYGGQSGSTVCGGLWLQHHS